MIFKSDFFERHFCLRMEMSLVSASYGFRRETSMASTIVLLPCRCGIRHTQKHRRIDISFLADNNKIFFTFAP